jgi:RNAse (barnase) inhibitor barstar
MTAHSTFDFGGLTPPHTADDCVVIVPTGLHHRGDLFHAFQEQLPLPDYFGNNWDALSECLRDLSWVKQRRIVLIHSDLPHFDSKSLASYLSVLKEAIESWKPGDQHELRASFPIGDRAAVERADSD